MSTFKGKVAEFPDIRIDYFRSDPDPKSRPPLVYFLSHVHSDHLLGLETDSKIITYCTPATRDILLRLEKYPHRMNFAKGILETRTQTYRHRKDRVKAISLEVPTEIELTPGRCMQVTAFDANHCVGACMFLIEGDGKAILYTGDIRSEVWWVNSLVRNPVLLPYACLSNGEPIKRLDCIYLDTTFVANGKEDSLRDFASKAQGIYELLRKVAQYPSSTDFYFDSWTFGYEDVWQALSRALDCRVHLDDYRFNVYSALENSIELLKAREAQTMIIYPSGNHLKPGYLTIAQSRLHSCEKGTGCNIWNKDFVRITPIISRYEGLELAELGAGGGQFDLNKAHELEIWDKKEVGHLMTLCAKKLQDDPELLAGVTQLLVQVMHDDSGAIKLEDFVDTFQTRAGRDDETGSQHFEDLDGLPLEKLVPALAKIVTNANLRKPNPQQVSEDAPPKSAIRADGLPKQITFPYSRHSSYNELHLLIEAFQPKDIFPCTVDEKNWNLNCSMSFLFGDIYNQFPPKFRHDSLMQKTHKLEDRPTIEDSRPGSTSSLSAAYATPNEDLSESRHEDIDSVRGKGRNSDEQNASKSRSKRCKIASSETRGDYWPRLERDHYEPPVEVDHHAPPHEVDHYAPPLEVYHYEPSAYTRRKYNSKPPVFSDKRVEEKAWPSALDYNSTVPRSPLGHSDTKTLPRYRHDQAQILLEYDRTAPHTNFLASSPVQKNAIEEQRSTLRQSDDYGRLSPPPTEKNARSNGTHVTSSNLEALTLNTRQPASSLSTKHSDNLSPTAAQRLAFRQEAYNAVLGIGESSWEDVGLVSVSGHQMKEEEL